MSNQSMVADLGNSVGRSSNPTITGTDYFYTGAYDTGKEFDRLEELLDSMSVKGGCDSCGGGCSTCGGCDCNTVSGECDCNTVSGGFYDVDSFVTSPIVVYENVESVDFKNDADYNNSLSVTSEETPLVIDTKTIYDTDSLIVNTSYEGAAETTIESTDDNIKTNYGDVRMFIEKYLKNIKSTNV